MYLVVAGLQPVLPSTLTIPPPDSSNSSFDHCNLMGGVYQCSYHSLFDCDPNINQFYTWNTNDLNDFQTITTEFSISVGTVIVMTYSPDSMSTTVSVKFTAHGTELIETYNSTRSFSGGNLNFTRLLQSDANQINITVGTSSTITIRRIIFCARNG